MKKNVSPLSSLVILSLAAGCANHTIPPEATRSTASFENRPRPNWEGRYDGPPPGFKRDQWERKPSAFMYCDKYRNETGRHVLACGAGVEEAINMAMRFAGSHGREDGYLRGYAWGMNQAINFWQNNQDEMLRGEGEVESLNSYLNRAVSEGQSAGSRDGDSLGVSEAKNRYYRAVDTKVMPNPNYQVPLASFNPTQDAYSRFVGNIPSPEDILKRDRYGRMRFYDGYDRSFYGPEYRERNGREMWTRDGVYNMNYNQWIEGEFAFKTWMNIPTPGKQRYMNLNDKVSLNDSTETNARLPAQAAPGTRPQRPGPGPGNAQPPVPPIAPPVTPPATPPVTPPVVVDYQAIFRDAFIQAYSAYAPAEYSRSYHMALDIGQRDGETSGAEVGIEIAHTKGLARAFNRKFAEMSYTNYQASYSNSYASGFQSTYEYFKTHPVLSLNFIGIIGSDDDGVVQPAEPFSAKFKVTNAGGISSPLKYTISGDIEDAQAFTNSIGPISTKTIESPTIGSVLSTLEDGSNATYVLDVNGMKEKLWQNIKRPLEFSEIKTNFSPIDGSGMYNVTVENIATVPVNGNISFELRINGNSVKTVVGTPMAPGEKKSYALDFASLDPLVWINGSYNIELFLKYNNITFARKSTRLTVGDTLEALAAYYTRLINEKAVIPQEKTLDNRMAEIKSLILQRNTAEVSSNIDSSGNIYRTNPENTIPGKVLRARDSYTNSSRAMSEFTLLADAMSGEAKRFKSVLFIHPKRDAYNELLSKIGGKKYK